MIKVLIADDQELFRQSLSIILKSEKDFEVTVDFDKAGRKRMYATFAKLVRI